MKALLSVSLFFALSVSVFAQSFSGQSSGDIFVVPPYRFCLGQDDGKNVCFVQSGPNMATVNGTLNIGTNATGIVLNPKNTPTENVITPQTPTTQALILNPAAGADPLLDTFQVFNQTGAQELGVEAGGNTQVGPNTEGPHVFNAQGGTGNDQGVLNCDPYGAFFGNNNQIQIGCTNGLFTVIYGGKSGRRYSAPWMTMPCVYFPQTGAVLYYNGVSWCGESTVPNATVGPVLASSGGSNHALTAPREDYWCTTTCMVTLPSPQAGFKFCIGNDDNVNTVITLGALGGSAAYENQAQTSYGTAGTGTIHSGGAIGDRICIEGKDSTHYNFIVPESKGTWTASAASPTFTVVQIYAPSTNANVNSDTCAGFLTPGGGGNSCVFHPVGALQATGNTAVVGCSAQAAGINASQTCVFTDSTGSVYTHPANCATFFPGNPKILDCGYTLNTAGSGSPFSVTVTVTTPIATGQRMGFVYAELHPNTGSGTLDGIGQINDNTACGTGTPCPGVPAANLSPAMAGTADGCVQMIIAGAGQNGVNSPWNSPSTDYVNNGDHSAFAVAVGLNSQYTPPLWTSNATASGAGLSICFK